MNYRNMLRAFDKIFCLIFTAKIVRLIVTKFKRIIFKEIQLSKIPNGNSVASPSTANLV